VKSFYLGLTPWLAFAVADRSAGLGPSRAALAGLVFALGICVLELRGRRVRPLPIIAAAQFSILATVSAGASRSGGVWRYDRAFAIGSLGVVFLVSSIVLPLSVSYARDAVAPRHWHDRRFLAANATLTRWWALALALVAASLALGAALASPLATTVLNWLIPIMIIASAATVLAPQSDVGSGGSAVRALDCLMSESRDDGARKGPRRLSW
jgi:hypothetical protein